MLGSLSLEDLDSNPLLVDLNLEFVEDIEVGTVVEPAEEEHFVVVGSQFFVPSDFVLQSVEMTAGYQIHNL